MNEGSKPSDSESDPDKARLAQEQGFIPEKMEQEAAAMEEARMRDLDILKDQEITKKDALEEDAERTQGIADELKPEIDQSDQ